MVLIDRELAVERFDYRRLQDGWGSLRLLAGIHRPLAAGTEPRLIVEADERYLATVGESLLELRLGPASRGGGLLWQATFAVPAPLVESPRALFGLASADGGVLALPAPDLRLVLPRSLTLTPKARRAQRLPLTQGRQLAAAATLAAVVGTSAPAVSLAAAAATARHPSSHVRNKHAAQGIKLVPVSQQPAATAPAGCGPQSQLGTVTFHSSVGSGANCPASTTAKKSQPDQPTTKNQPAAAPRPTKAHHLTQLHHTAKGNHPAGIDHTAKGNQPAGIDHTAKVHQPAGASHSATSNHAASVSHPAKRNQPAKVNHPAALHHPATPAPKPTHIHAHKPATHAHTGNGAQPHSSKGTHHDTGAFPGGSTPGHSGRGHSVASTPAHPAHGGHTPAKGASPPLIVAPGSNPVPVLSPTPGYANPGNWTGTVTNDPALTGAVQDLAGLLANGNRPPSFLIPIYMQAGRRYHIPWEVLAAINAVETDYGRDLSTSTAGAVGWMQFMPGTWKEWGVAADGHSVPNPYDPRDAIFSAARYLAAAGGAQDITRAVFAYNHANWYVQDVLSRAQGIAHHAQYLSAQVNRRGTFSVSFETGLRKHPTVRYSGGVLSHYDRLIAAANMVSAANFPYLYGGGHEQPARWGPFDCSGSVSYVMQQAGYNVPTTVSGDIPSWKFPAGPGRVTIFYNPGHTFMRIGDRYFGTSGFARPGGGAGWFDTSVLPASYLAGFREVHVPELGPDNFAPTLNYIWPRSRRHGSWWDPMHLPRVFFFRAQR